MPAPKQHTEDTSLLPPAPVHARVDVLSLAVIYATTLVSEAGRGIVLPSQWPYLRSMGGSDSFLGVLVAAFSFGRMLATIPLGFLSDALSMRWVLILASAVQIAGNVMYTLAQGQYSLLIARIVVGLGSATMSVCRAHIARAIPKSLRTPHFAYLSALQFVGFAVLPGAGGLLAILPRFSLFGGTIQLNEFTYPGWALVLANALIIIALHALYTDPPQPGAPKPASVTSLTTHTPTSQPAPTTHLDETPDWPALAACLVINITFRGAVAELETVSAPFLMLAFDLTLPRASLILFSIGSAGLLVYILYGATATRIPDRAAVLAGVVALVVAVAVLAQPWIALPQIPYITALALVWSLAYPLGQTAILSLFSKKLGTLPAGGFLGLFSMAGSGARLVFAVVASTSWSIWGQKAVFVGMTVYSIACLWFLGVVYKRLDVDF